MSEEEIEPRPVKMCKLDDAEETDVWYDAISDTSSVNDDDDILESHVEWMSSTGTISLVSSSPKPYYVEGPPDISIGKMGNTVQPINIHFPVKRVGTGRLRPFRKCGITIFNGSNIPLHYS